MEMKDFAGYTDQEILEKASEIIFKRDLRGKALTNPDEAAEYLTHKLSSLSHEIFAIFFLDNSNQVIKYEEIFRGTIDRANVHPREVVKESLLVGAKSLILAHNHPSGSDQPSQADLDITRRLADACNLLDIEIHDHIIVAGSTYYSFKQNGLM